MKVGATVCALAATFGLFFNCPAATTGSYYGAAVSLSGTKTVTLTAEYDPDFKEYDDSGDGVYYFKFSASRYSAWTVTATGGIESYEIELDVSDIGMYSESEVWAPWFETSVDSDGFSYRSILYSTDWDDDCDSKVTFIVCISGTAGRAVTVQLQSGAIEEPLPAGHPDNPVKLTAKEGTASSAQTYSGTLVDGDFYFEMELIAGRRYLIGTTGGTEDNPLAIEVDEGDLPEACTVQGYTPWIDDYNSAYSLIPGSTGIHTIRINGDARGRFGFKYVMQQARLPENHPNILSLSQPTGSGVSAEILPGRRVVDDSEWFDSVIDESLVAVSLRKDESYSIVLENVFTNLTLEVYTKGETRVLESRSALRWVPLDFTPLEDGQYYIGVCRTDGEMPSQPVLLTVIAHRAVTYVASKGVDAEGRGYADSPYATVQRAIDDSEPGCEIRVGAGTFAPFDDHGNAYRIVGAGSAKTIVDGKGMERCATLEGGSTLVGMTLRNGRATHGGGVCAGHLEDCIVEKCRAEGTEGGGTYDTELTRCIIRNNVSANDGGGVWSGTARNTLIIGNRAENGDGAPCGGGAYGSALYGCTVVGNVSMIVDETECGAVDNCSLVNCVVANNVDQRGNAANLGEGVGAEHVCCYPASGMEDGDMLFSADPRFANIKKGNYQLTADSPCINWGDDAVVGEDETDLNGKARIQQGRIDLGCYESAFTRPKVTVKFDANGGKASVAKLAFEMGGAYDGLPVPTRADYRFLGWFSAKTGGALVEDGTPLLAATTHTLYAQWIHATTVKVSDGLVSGVETYVGEEGEEVSLEAEDRSDNGYVFSGWTVSPATASLGDGYDEYSASCSIIIPAVNVSLTANYLYKPAYLSVDVSWEDQNSLGGNGGIEWSVDGKKWYSTDRRDVPVKGGMRTPTATMVRFRSVDARWTVSPSQTTVDLLREESYTVAVTATRRCIVTWRAETEDEQSGFSDHGKGAVKVSPANGVLSSKGVTLTATPAKDAVFVGWMDEKGSLVSVAEKYAIASGTQASDVVLVPRFRLKSECTAAAELSIDAVRPTRAMVGVRYMLPVIVDNDLARPLTFSAKNLPKGLSIDATSGRISGLPTKAGTFSATIVATSKANKKVSASVPVFFRVVALPSWAQGTFTGSVAYESGEEYDEESGEYVTMYEHAPVTFTIGADGAFSSKGKVNGTSYAVKGKGFAPFDDDGGGDVSGWDDEDPSMSSLRLTASVTIGKDTSSSFDLKLWPLQKETEAYAFTTGMGDGTVFHASQLCCGLGSSTEELPVSLWRSVSGEKSLANALRHMAGTYHWGDDDWLEVKVDDKGKVKATGLRPTDGASISATSSLMIGEDGTFCTIVHQPSSIRGSKSLCCGLEEKVSEFYEIIPLDYCDSSDELQPWLEGVTGDIANAMVGVPLSLKVCADWDESDLVFSASGLPKGLSINKTTGVISGTPTAKSSGSVYVSVASKSDKNVFGSVVVPVASVSAVPTWVVGSYSGAIRRDDLGWGSFSATVSDKGKTSGKMTFGTAVYSFTANSFEETSHSAELHVTASATTKKGDPLDVVLTLASSDYPTETSGDVTETRMAAPYDWDTCTYPAGELVSVFRNGWTEKVKASLLADSGLCGRYTAIFGDGGDGYVTLTVDRKGTVQAAGKLGDGTAYSASGVLAASSGWIEPEAGGRALDACEVALYAVPKGFGGGYVVLPLRFSWSEDGWLLGCADYCGLAHNSSPKATENYGEGLEREFNVDGRPYKTGTSLGSCASALRPNVSQPTLCRYDKSLDDVLEWSPIWMACLDPSDDTWLRLTVKDNKVTVPKSTKGSVDAGFYGKNDANFSMKFDAKTGVVSGSYTLWYDTDVSATYAYEGVWVQDWASILAACPSFGVGFDAQDKPYVVKQPGPTVQLILEVE